MRFSTRMPEGKFAAAKRMRKAPTVAERHLWQILRKRPDGFKWRRQHPMLGYIADFYCPALFTAIEVDGGSHAGREKYDALRDRRFKHHGVTVRRISNDDALKLGQDSIGWWLGSF